MTKAPMKEYIMPRREVSPALRRRECSAKHRTPKPAMVEAEGAETRMLPIAKDKPDALAAAFRLAEGADMVVTIGGASVGDHDLVGAVAEEAGPSPRPGRAKRASRANRMRKRANSQQATR